MLDIGIVLQLYGGIATKILQALVGSQNREIFRFNHRWPTDAINWPRFNSYGRGNYVNIK